MHPDELFLGRCDRINDIIQRDVDPLLTLELASIIRQMFFDAKSLVDVVNKRKLKLVFVTTRSDFKLHTPGPPPAYGPHDKPDHGASVWLSECMMGAIDPTGTDVPECERVELTANQFGQHAIGRIEGVPYTVKTVVKYAANKQGGVHWDDSWSDQESNLMRRIESGSEFGSRIIGMWNAEILLIASVYLRGLAPLIADVHARHVKP
jgi:hypothetical protein